jgi:galactokinase
LIRDPQLAASVRERFTSVFGGAAEGLAVAPGRVNLIGEHTDYNDGFVLPMGIERGLSVAFRRRADGLLRVHSLAREETRELTLARLAPVRAPQWIDYVAGVAWVLAGAGHPVGGADLAIGSDLPMGAGLSSSAALEVAVARALCAAYGIAWDAIPFAKLCQRAENEYVGLSCGVMDQFAAAASRVGRALLLDCRSLQVQAVPLPAHVAVVVMDTGVRRSLAASAYNDRRASCERAVERLREVWPDARALRDVTPDMLQAERGRLDERTWKRAAHVVSENVRPLAAADALRHADLATAGALMNDSHASLRDLYEVSCEELDYMVERAVAQPGCHGARMTGAGFGGCAVALVDSAAADAFVRAVESEYRERYDLPAHCFACRPAEGAHLL